MRIKASYTAKSGVVAAAYACACWALGSLAFGPVQIRPAEALLQLAAIDPLWIPALVLGNAIANIGSPLGPIDIAVGIITAITCTAPSVFAKGRKGKYICIIAASALSMSIVAWELGLVMALPFWQTWAGLALSQSITTSCGAFVVDLISRRINLDLGA
ncbi:MAG: QueT transporter family protein [Eubacteriaceae bacterium]|jgi:uncharacterized membrane protein|nr:QueT transporter family protein [Eubacteriaceae bacterium]